jgi:hypothetical protein
MVQKETTLVVHLYRRILKAAARFPSVKRNDIIRDIKVEFRENKGLTDEAVIRDKVAVAARGAEELESYVSMESQEADSWQKTLKGSCH